jgi:hypothetical protein
MTTLAVTAVSSLRRHASTCLCMGSKVRCMRPTPSRDAVDQRERLGLLGEHWREPARSNMTIFLNGASNGFGSAKLSTFNRPICRTRWPPLGTAAAQSNLYPRKQHLGFTLAPAVGAVIPPRIWYGAAMIRVRLSSLSETRDSPFLTRSPARCRPTVLAIRHRIDMRGVSPYHTDPYG